MTEQKGGEMGDQRIGADEIRFDRNKKNEGGQETELDGSSAVSDSAKGAEESGDLFGGDGPVEGDVEGLPEGEGHGGGPGERSGSLV